MVNSQAGAIFFLSVFFGFLFFVSSLGGDAVVSGDVEPTNPDEVDACQQGNNLQCGLQTLDSLTSWLGAKSGVAGLNYVLLVPLGVLLVWSILKALPTT